VSDATYTPLGAVIRIDAPVDVDAPPHVMLERAVAVPAALMDVCRPLEVTLLPGLRAAGVPVLEAGPAPPPRQIVEADLPERIVIRPPEDGEQQRAPALTPETLAAWATDAVTAERAPAGLEVTLAALVCGASMARVDSLPPDADTYVVLDERPVEHPVLRRDGALWVPAPVDDLLMQPAVAWRVARDVELRAELWVNWSPWLDVERPEGAGLRAAVETLRHSGWALREPVYELELAP
jgi:hypothetical protein